MLSPNQFIDEITLCVKEQYPFQPILIHWYLDIHWWLI